ncbi:hypothetical protein DFQ27_005021 [Actinomortierella ambigua]|uniref:Uncharacterized protein n=1 Tax=Actinomortierella ambigua TaxID=1343610 RepID=A0A9P6U368_9FUNG|nr:hypothetical protein DFQ27_005021 [Actinomortierella ambigua]
MAVVQPKGRGRGRGSAATGATTLAVEHPADTSTFPGSNTPFVKDTVREAAATTGSTSSSPFMSPDAPKAPKSRISAKISGTIGRAPLLEVSDTDVTSNSKRPKRVTTKRATGSLAFSDDESDQDSVTRPTKMVQRFQGPGGSTVRRPPMHQKRQSQPPMTAPEIISASVPIDGPALIEALATQHIAFNRAVEAMVARHQKQLEQREERFKARIEAQSKAQEARIKAQEARINDLLKPLQETCEKTQQIYCPQCLQPPQYLHPNPLHQHYSTHQHHHVSQGYQYLYPQLIQHHAPQQQEQEQEQEKEQGQEQEQPPSPPPPQKPFHHAMHPDKFGWTLRNAWEEFHGPVTRSYAESYKTWSESEKKQYRRRKQLIELIKKKALEEVRTIDSILDVNDYRGMSLNAVRELLKSEGSKAE